MDALSQVISLLKPQAFILGTLQGHSPWSLGYESFDYVKLGLLVEGGCWLVPRARDPVRLEEGDAWFLIKPIKFALTSDLSLPMDYGVEDLPYHGRHRVVGTATSTGERTTVFGGRLNFEPSNAGLLFDHLPEVLVQRGGDAANSSLRSLLTLLQRESKVERPGSAAAIENLIQLAFVEVLRGLDLERLEASHLRGLTHPDLGPVLQAIHADVQRDWTVADLAEVYGASRSAFASAFKSTVGTTPMEYLQRWRIVRAKEALRDSTLRVSEVAFLVGYQSDTAFSTAFSRVVGKSPRSYRAELANEIVSFEGPASLTARRGPPSVTAE